jgi:hypothetical protein
MPRRQHVHLDDVPLHIVPRGHKRGPCFFGDEDCCTYLHLLGEALTEDRRTVACLCTHDEPRAFAGHSHRALTVHLVSELRLAVNQKQLLGNARFYETIERIWAASRGATARVAELEWQCCE